MIRFRNRSSGLFFGKVIHLFIIIILAFGLRVYKLDGQSLWHDEGISAVMAARSMGEIMLNAAGDVHPPLYYLALRWWALAAGSSEFSLRFLSLVFGVLVVVFTYKIGEAVLGAPAALVGAFFSALSPFQVYYSQEARMYTQMAALSAVSLYFFWRLVRYWGAWSLSSDNEGKEASRWLWLMGAYILASVSAIYTQYFALAIIALENLFFALVFWPFWRGPRRWLWWLGGQGAIALAFAPWLGVVMGQVSGWSTEGSPIGAGKFLQTAFYVFSIGRWWQGVTWVWVVPFLALFLTGVGAVLWGLKGCDKKGPGVPAYSFPSLMVSSYGFLVLWLIVPVLITYLVAQRRPLYFPEYFKLVLPSSPAFSLLLGVGAVSISRVLASVLNVKQVGTFLAALSLVFAGMGNLQPLSLYYQDAKYSRDNYRGLVSYIENSSRPGDAIIIDAPGQKEVFNYYYGGGLPQYPLPQKRPIDEEATIKDVEAILLRHNRIWAVFWALPESDPNRVVERWLAQYAFLGVRRWFGGVELALYDVPGAGATTPLEDSKQWELGGEVKLTGYKIDGGFRAEDGSVAFRPGDVIQLALFWQAENVKGRYKVFTHLLDDDGYIWGQHDSEPEGGTRPTTTWQPGETVLDRHGILIYLGTPPGRYKIEVGLYDQGSGARLPRLDDSGRVLADFVAFGQVEVLKGSPVKLEALSLQSKADVAFGPLRLVGYDVARLGVGEPADTFPKGAFLHLTLYWQPQRKPERDYKVIVQVRVGKGQVVFSKETYPVAGRYPTRKWDEKELVVDQHKFPLDMVPGQYQLLLGVKEGDDLVPFTRGSDRSRLDMFLLKTIKIQG